MDEKDDWSLDDKARPFPGGELFLSTDIKTLRQKLIDDFKDAVIKGHVLNPIEIINNRFGKRFE